MSKINNNKCLYCALDKNTIQCYRIKRLKVQLNYNRIKRLKNAKN